MWYNVFGTINTIFIFLSLIGIYAQLKKIWIRKNHSNTKSTQILSQNQFTVSFLAYYSFFVFGYSLTPINHYLVWPRLIASLLVAMILLEMWKDRRSGASLLSLIIAGISLVFGLLGLIYGQNYFDQSKDISTSLIVIITLFLAQGYVHQIHLIVKSGETGAIDIKMSQFILMMDISTIAFALTMGVYQGWPLLFLASVSAITKLIIMYLFLWVRLSPVAERRRLVPQKA